MTAEPVGRPQGGMKSEAGRAAYWRMQFESCQGALADLIAEHTETVAEVERLRGQVARVRALAAQWSDSDERTWVSNLGDELYTALAEPEAKS